MRAVVCRAPGEVAVEDIDEPTPLAFEVKVAVTACGVCHTDLNFTSGQVPVPYPIVLGHEAAGVVTEIGAGVTAVAVGDHVVCSIIGPCGQCYFCIRGEHAMCENAPFFTGKMLDGTTRLTQNGVPMHTLHYQGSYAEYAIVPERFVVPVRHDAPLDVVCGLACGLSTGLGASLVRAEVTPGSSVVVIGSGGVGLATMMGAKFKGATTIIAVDVMASKLAKAVEIGLATHTIDARTDDVVQAILDLTGGRGSDFAFDAAGVPGTLDQALAGTRPGGMCVVIGRQLGTVDLTVSTTALLRQRILTGTYGGSIHPRRHIPTFVDLHLQGAIDLGAILDTRYSIEDAPQALDDLHHGRVTRGVLLMNH